MRFAIDPESMLAKCERLQWSVDEIDWDAPGAEVVTDEDRAALSGFMADLHWIESIAAIVFGAMRDRTREPALRGIFASFAVDERRHADGELLLMRRWGICGRHEVPPPNIDARNLLRALERSAHRVHPAVFSAIIPFTELVLDGALVKHLDARVKDPVCGRLFRKINADEARHLAVDFYMLERFGGERTVTQNRLQTLRTALHPEILYALLLGYLPMLFRSRPNIRRMGLTDEQLYACIRRYIDLGDESAAVARHPTYALFRRLSRRIVAGKSDIGELLMRVSDVCEKLGLRMPEGGARAAA